MNTESSSVDRIGKITAHIVKSYPTVSQEFIEKALTPHNGVTPATLYCYVVFVHRHADDTETTTDKHLECPFDPQEPPIQIDSRFRQFFDKKNYMKSIQFFASMLGDDRNTEEWRIQAAADCLCAALLRYDVLTRVFCVTMRYEPNGDSQAKNIILVAEPKPITIN